MDSLLKELQLDLDIKDATTESFAEYLDSLPLALPHLRSQYAHPTAKSIGNGDGDDPAIYFIGNSLGLMPLELRTIVNQELDIWAGRGVLGHFDHPLGRPWKDITDTVQASMAKIVGAEPSEVAVMGSLTANLHHLMHTFYRPQGRRTKIVFEDKAFPSDRYAFASQVQLHGYRADEHLIAIRPRPNEYHLRTEDILQILNDNRDDIAILLLPGVQYYTGQYFDIEEITKKGHEIGAIVGWDLAHAVGNLPVRLHDWQVDFACWCNYKYLSAGPGAIGGLFVHEKARYPQGTDTGISYQPRPAGWWGHDAATRFKMDPIFDPIQGAAGFQLSNPSVLNVVSLLASLNVFDQTNMGTLRRKSLLLTGYLQYLLELPTDGQKTKGQFQVITPSDPASRGAQLSLLFCPLGSGLMQHVMKMLLAQSIIGDEREPDVIRLSPVPMYNTFSEVRIVANAVRQAVASWDGSREDKKIDEAMMSTT